MRKYPSLIIFYLLLSYNAVSSACPVENSMQRFLSTFQKKDGKKFLTFISRSRSFRIIDTTAPRTKKRSTQTLTYALLSKDFREHGVWYFNFINGMKEVGGFKDNVNAVTEKTKARWKKIKGNKFFPPVDVAMSRRSEWFVKWRKEDGKWVIEAIGQPYASDF